MIGASPIRFHAPAAPLAWETDPRLLQQALLNLVRNAVDAGAGEPVAEVRLEVRLGEDGGIAIAVTENGPGIPEQVRAKVGEPFLTTKASGTGLGLAITAKLAAARGGELALRPNPPRGTEAALRFPKAWPRPKK